MLHPQQIMERGYAMVLDRSTGARAQSVTALHANQDVLLRFHDGATEATVTGPIGPNVASKTKEDE